MWNRGSRSSALERAQALLSVKRNNQSAAQPVERFGGKVPKARTPGQESPVSVPFSKSVHSLSPDLSDLSSVSSVTEHRDRTTTGSAATQKNHGGKSETPKDSLPQASMGEVGGVGGSRFLKKVPQPATASSQSSPAVAKSQTTHLPEHRIVSSSQSSSQSAALCRLASVKERIHNRKWALVTKGQTSDSGGCSRQAASLSEVPADPRAQSSLADMNPTGNRFIKKSSATAASDSIGALPKGTISSAKTLTVDAAVALAPGTLSTSMALANTGVKQIGAASSVGLDSDEEDMRRLLGDSLDSTEDSLLRRLRSPTTKRAGQAFKTQPATAASPPERGSPLRFPSPTRGQAWKQGQGQPSSSFSARSASVVRSLSPAQPLAASSPPPHRPGSAFRAQIPPHPLSSASGHSEVRSLEELFTEDSHSEKSQEDISSMDFKMNIMTLDDLAPITLGSTDEAKGEMKELTSSKHNPCSRDHQDNQQREEEEEEEEQQEEEEEEEEDEEEETCGEETNDYQSDFESASRSEPGYSASEIYERLGGDGEEDGETDDDGDTSEIREEGGCQGQGKRDRYSSDVSHGNSSQSWGSKMSTLHSGSSTPSSDSYSACTVTPVSRSRRRTLPERAVREAAVQTQPGVLSYAWSAGMATMDPSLGMAFVDPTPVATHTISAETVQALSTYSPAVFALNDMLRQQLAMTRRFVQASRHLHTTLVQSLGPADYTYTTLQDLKELIRKLRPAKLTVDQAKQEVLQEMRDHHYI